MPDRSHALDHIVVVLFENRSLDNVFGHLYGPGDGKSFDGVIGKNLSNPIPAWAEHGAERKVVPYTVATDMDSPNPDSGEEYQHTNTQLYNILNEKNRFKVAGDRSFWTAATSSGLVVNSPAKKWFTGNDAETIFERLEAHGKTWKVYLSEPMQISFTGIIHYQRLKDRLATHFVPFAQFEADAAKGALPDFALIEPALLIGHNDYHPALGRSLGHGVALPGVDPPASILGGEAFLARIYDAYRGMQSGTGSNVWNTTLLISWDEPGGTYDHVPPPAVPPPDPAAPPGEFGFTFDRSGYRVPAIVISPWVAEGQVFNQEHRHTSLITTLREQWNLGDPFTARDAAARTFSHAFTLEAPRDPRSWPAPAPRPVPAFSEEDAALGKVASALGRTFLDGLRQHAQENDIKLEGLPDDPKADIPPGQIVTLLRSAAAMYFPLLAPAPAK